MNLSEVKKLCFLPGNKASFWAYNFTLKYLDQHSKSVLFEVAKAAG